MARDLVQRGSAFLARSSGVGRLEPVSVSYRRPGLRSPPHHGCDHRTALREVGCMGLRIASQRARRRVLDLERTTMTSRCFLAWFYDHDRTHDRCECDERDQGSCEGTAPPCYALSATADS